MTRPKLAICYGLLMFCGVACTEDIEPVKQINPALELVELQLINFSSSIELPDGLIHSNDINAQQAVAHISSLESLEDYFLSMIPPPSASKSAEAFAVTHQGDDASHESVAYLVYKWWEEDTRIIYQISMDDTHYYFDLYYQFDQEDSHIHLLHAYQSQTETRGELHILLGEQEFYNEVVYSYQWQEAANGDLTFDYQAVDFFHMSSIIHPDQSGVIEYFIDQQKVYLMEWDPLGNGNWIYYFNGEIQSQGNWRI